MSKKPGLVALCSVAFAILLGGAVGGLAGWPCQTCSVDGSRILIGAGVCVTVVFAAAVYQAYKQRWLTAGALMALLLPATYCGAALAQRVGIWWDHF